MPAMTHWMSRLAACASVLLATPAASAHFQALLPSADIAAADTKTIDLRIIFTHAMEQGPVMDMGRPVRFGVLVDGKTQDLLPSLKLNKFEGKTGYLASFTPKQPGDHVFYLEPAPYWEQAEQKYIVHYTKVVVSVFEKEEGWDAAVGFPVEIEPLVRPYGLWTGNVFRGIVRKQGKPLPFAIVEVEYWNEGRQVKPPAGAFVTQVVKADANGVFSYAMPRAGWWGFAALTTADQKKKGPDGNDADVELGGLIWVRCLDMK